jgi:phospholipid transport system substrate-binding protein
MKKFISVLILMSASWLSYGATPTEAAQKAVEEILKIAQGRELPAEQRKAQLEEVIKEYVDLPSASQRVLAQYWRTASTEEKKDFVLLFRKVLTNTYFNLLQEYNNEEVLFTDERIKKDIYAEVESTVISKGKSIPITYRLMLRNDTWKIYDFSAEGVSIVRSFNNSYSSILRSGGVSELNKTLQQKIDENGDTSAP